MLGLSLGLAIADGALVDVSQGGSLVNPAQTLAGSGGAYSPEQMSGALLILDAAVGFTPSSWAAVVGSAATQGTGAKQGSLVSNALNGQPGVLFGAGQFMAHSASLAAPGTILAVAKSTGDAAHYRTIMNTNGLFLAARMQGTGNVGMFMGANVDSGLTDTAFAKISAQVSAANNVTFRVNGVSSGAITTGVAYYTSGDMTIGGDSITLLQDLLGTICYVGVWNRVLTSGEIASWESYANTRWGL